mgnify:CR=1 FL=1
MNHILNNIEGFSDLNIVDKKYVIKFYDNYKNTPLTDENIYFITKDLNKETPANDCFDRFVFDLVIEEMKLSRQLDDKEFVKQKYLATKELILNLLKK